MIIITQEMQLKEYTSHNIFRIQKHYWDILTLFYRQLNPCLFHLCEIESYEIDKEGNLMISDCFQNHKYTKFQVYKKFNIEAMNWDEMHKDSSSEKQTVFYCYKNLYELKLEEPNYNNKLNKKIVNNLKSGDSLNIFVPENGGYSKLVLFKNDFLNLNKKGFTFLLDTHTERKIQFDNIIFYSNRTSLFDDIHIKREFEILHFPLGCSVDAGEPTVTINI